MAIMLDFTGDEELAQQYYQDFKFKFVAGWGDKWSISSVDIEEWIEKKEVANGRGKD